MSNEIDANCRATINRQLDDFTDKNCLHCYAAMRPDGTLHLDGHFCAAHLLQILMIAGAILL